MTPTASAHLATWKTDLWLTVRGARADEPKVQAWTSDLLGKEVGRLDLAASRFRPDSEISAVNRRPGRWTEVSWYFVSVLTASLQAARATSGLVDPTLGHEVADAGYDRWAGQDSGLGRAEPRPADADWRAVEIRPGSGQAQVRIPPGTALDVGSVAKGWLADRMAGTVQKSLGYDAMANCGGDLRCVSRGEPWTIWAEPDLPGVQAAGLDVTDAAMATSGTGHRAWDGPDGGGHHIIDPRTGRSARTPWQSVSVLAADAAGANAAATAAVILGEQGPEWLTDLGLSARLVGEGRDVYVGHWPGVQEGAA